MIADVPGLIEGAAEGAGLGHQFLKHLSRTRVLLHLVDLAPFDENVDPVYEAAAIVEELRKYDEDLWAKPRWLVLNKIDMIAEEDRKAKIDDFVTRYREKTGWQGQVHPISSLTGENTANLMRSVYENLVQQMQVEFPPEPDARFRESTGTLINPQETGDDQE